MRPEQSAAMPGGALWRQPRSTIGHTLRGIARIAEHVRTRRPSARPRRRAAVRDAPAAPIAIWLDGNVMGLALKLGNGFVFFSATHRTDALDGRIFTEPGAIREAVAAAIVADAQQAAGRTAADAGIIADGAGVAAGTLAVNTPRDRRSGGRPSERGGSGKRNAARTTATTQWPKPCYSVTITGPCTL
jgi:hypothetical protein